MAKLDSTLERHLRQRPDETVRLIVRVSGDVSEATEHLRKRGVAVLRSFSLVPAVVVSCAAETALDLLQEPWVQAMEPDRKVTVQNQGAPSHAPEQRSEQ
jgi:hypothetical protein